MFRRLAISCLLIAFAVPAPARTRPHYGGTLHMETVANPWQRPNGIARRLVFDALTSIASDGSIHPALAIDWQSDDSFQRWQFRLRPGVHFHDGSALTTSAVVASLATTCPSNCPWTAVRATGSSVVFTSDAPMPNLPALLDSDQFLIAQTMVTDGKTPSGAIGTGPFQAAGLLNDVLTLKANDSCWQGRPFVDSIEIRFRRSPGDQALDLAAERADIVELPAESLREARQHHFALLTSPSVDLLALEAAETGPLANPNLRAALSAAIDRTSLANVIFQREAQATAAVLPQSLSGYAFLFPAERDLKKAHELRGGLNPPPLYLRVEGGGILQLAAQRIALALREAGFNVQTSATMPQPPALTLRSIALEGGSPAVVLDRFLRAEGHPHPNLASDPAGLFKAEREFLDRKTLIPLVHLPRAYAVSPRVNDMAQRADGTPDLAAAWLELAP